MHCITKTSCRTSSLALEIIASSAHLRRGRRVWGELSGAATDGSSCCTGRRRCRGAVETLCRGEARGAGKAGWRERRRCVGAVYPALPPTGELFRIRRDFSAHDSPKARSSTSSPAVAAAAAAALAAALAAASCASAGSERASMRTRERSLSRSGRIPRASSSWSSSSSPTVRPSTESSVAPPRPLPPASRAAPSRAPAAAATASACRSGGEASPSKMDVRSSAMAPRASCTASKSFEESEGRGGGAGHASRRV